MICLPGIIRDKILVKEKGDKENNHPQCPLALSEREQRLQELGCPIPNAQSPTNPKPFVFFLIVLIL
jgi:hypothetical protein